LRIRKPSANQTSIPSSLAADPTLVVVLHALTGIVLTSMRS
jgi:hypothetical protein